MQHQAGIELFRSRVGNPEMGSRKSGNDTARHKDTGTFAGNQRGEGDRAQVHRRGLESQVRGVSEVREE